MNQNPPYFWSHSTLESIYFFCSSFIFSSFLNMGVDYITFISCAFLHIIAGFDDPAFLNTVFLAIGQIFNFIFILIEKSPQYTFVFQSWIPKVRTRPRKMFLNWYKPLNNYELYSNISMLNNFYLRNTKIHLTTGKKSQIFPSGKNIGTSKHLILKNINDSGLKNFNRKVPFFMENSVPLVPAGKFLSIGIPISDLRNSVVGMKSLRFSIPICSDRT